MEPQFLLVILSLVTTNVKGFGILFHLMTQHFIFDNCEQQLESSSVSHCMLFCGLSEQTCHGINFLPLEETETVKGYCQLCLATKSSTLVPALSSNQISYGTSFNTFVPSSGIRCIPLKSGLYEGLVLTFHVVVESPKISIRFLNGDPREIVGYPDTNLYLDLNVDTQLIGVNFYKNGNLGISRNYRLQDYFATFGQEAEVVVSVTEEYYNIYLDGKPLPPYPRQRHIALEDVLSQEKVKSVSWTDLRND